MLTGPSQTVRFARDLRGQLTLPEVILWGELRKRPAGLKFRRQHPAGAYVLDFFCAGAALAVEVDGEAHGRGAQPAHDASRDAWLTGEGVRVLRLTASSVLNDLPAVVQHIVATAATFQPLHHSPAARVPGRSCPRHDLASRGAIPPDTPPPRHGEEQERS